MGGSSSRIDKNEALHLCKERKSFIKQAVDSRYNLTAAHISYIQSLRSLGIALRRFAEAEALVESPLSASAQSHSTYPSPSPSHDAEPLDEIPHSPSPTNNTRMSYMRLGGSTAVTVRVDPSFNNRFLEDDSLTFPPPPPPPPEMGPSWDFFDPTDLKKKKNSGNCPGLSPNDSTGMLETVGSVRSGTKSRNRLVVSNVNPNSGDGLERFEEAEQAPLSGGKLIKADCGTNESDQNFVGNATLETTEREDPSEFITHRAKDFLSSIRDVEHRFFRASESGKEVSRMLEANKIQLSCSKAEGRSPTSIFVAALHLACCRGEIDLANEPPQQMTKVITWNRSISSQSSSSKNLLPSESKGDVDDSGSDFVEEYSMITGRHSSTLDRILAWERKLYDEVKASESIKKQYDQQCNQLRHQFARDANSQAIDKTRAVVKDLHSQIRVALHAVDSIAKRIEKLRDEELQPQLVELIQGLNRMWKDMLECHHAQYITISLAYHAKNSTLGPADRESHRQIGLQLKHEIECFGSSFANWIFAHRSYVEALNGWLQTCIILPQERSSKRRAFSPRRALAPPIFVLCHDWAAGTKDLPSGEAIDAIKSFASDVHRTVTRQVEEEQKKTHGEESHDGEAENNEESESRDEAERNQSCNVSSIHTSLANVLDRLTKFAEGSRKMYEEIRQSTEAAQLAYTNCRATRF